MAVKQRTRDIDYTALGTLPFYIISRQTPPYLSSHFLVHTVGSLTLLHVSVEVTIGLAIHVTLVLLLVHVVAVGAVAHIALIVLATLAILELIQHTTHLQQAHPLLSLAHGSAVQARCRVEPAVGVSIALGVGLERSQPVCLGVGGHLCHVAVARDGEFGGLGAIRVGQRAELGAVAAGHEVLGDHVGALRGGVDGDGGGPVNTADPAHGGGLGVGGIEVHAGDEAGEGGAAKWSVSTCDSVVSK